MPEAGPRSEGGKAIGRASFDITPGSLFGPAKMAPDVTQK